MSPWCWELPSRFLLQPRQPRHGPPTESVWHSRCFNHFNAEKKCKYELFFNSTSLYFTESSSGRSTLVLLPWLRSCVWLHTVWACVSRGHVAHSALAEGISASWWTSSRLEHLSTDWPSHRLTPTGGDAAGASRVCGQLIPFPLCSRFLPLCRGPPGEMGGSARWLAINRSVTNGSSPNEIQMR